MNKINKWIFFITILFLIPIGFSCITVNRFTHIRYSDGLNACGVLFSTIGIFYSISLSIIFSFSFEKLKSTTLIELHRKQLKECKNKVTFYFVIALILEIIIVFNSDLIIIIPNINLKFNSIVASMLILMFLLVFTIVNFSSLAKSKIKLEDELK
jgi:hypothetical protein